MNGSIDPLAKPTPFGGPERRLSPRKRLLLSGKLIVSGGRMSPDCTIRNISPNGAQVRISRTVDLPRDVALLVIRDGVLYEARVIWRRGADTGLAFNGAATLHGEVAPGHRGVQALWKELLAR